MPTGPTNRPPTPIPPPFQHLRALMIWLAVLPTLTVLNTALSNLMTDTPVVPRTFILATIAAPVVMYGLMPRLHQLRARLLARQVVQ